MKTFFEFVLKGFDKLGYKEHLDYDLVESSNPAFGKSIVRINVTRNHRQTIQYILPQHHERAATAELLVIDEAAAIPSPTVKALLGPYLVFLCSTINGYEGTGRALSIKLIGNLRREASSSSSGQQGRHGKNNKHKNAANQIDRSVVEVVSSKRWLIQFISQSDWD